MLPVSQKQSFSTKQGACGRIADADTSVGTKTEECRMCIIYILFRGELLQESLIDVLIRISAMCETDFFNR